MGTDDLAIIIVTHNSAGPVGPCLEACLALHPRELLVIDNASSDATLAVVAARGVAAIANPVNAGFATAVNQGFAATDSPFVLLLNPDAVPLTPLQPLIDEFESPEVGAASGLLLDAGLRPQAGFTVRRFPTPAALIFECLGLNRLFPANPVNRAYRCRDLDLTRPAAVEQPAGAFLMIRRSAWRAAGGFDERYHPLWFEDVDFCHRLQAAGFGIRFNPGATAEHEGGHSIRGLSWDCRQLYWYASLLRYSAGHFSPVLSRLVALSAMIGSFPRALAGIPAARSLEPLKVFVKVVRLAGLYLLFGCTIPSRGQIHHYANTSSTTASR